MFKTLVYSAFDYDKTTLGPVFYRQGLTVQYTDAALTPYTADEAAGFNAVCCFVNDDLSRRVLGHLKVAGVELVLLRCAGFDRVDLQAARELGIRVARVPAYSPDSIAEHALALCLAIARKLPQTALKQGANDYSLDGLTGFTLRGKVVGIIGGGKIGQATANLFRAFGCPVVISDPYYEGTDKVSRDFLLKHSDIISLHCPLTAETEHLINEQTIAKMKRGVVLINTARGGLVNQADLLYDLNNTHRIRAYAADVTEDESSYAFRRFAAVPRLVRQLRAHPNVILTGHQAFLTQEALTEIAEQTVRNIETYLAGGTDDAVLV